MKKSAFYELKSLTNDIRRKSFCHRGEHIRGHGPKSPAQIQIIEYLFKNPDKNVSQKDLEAITDIRKSTISGILDTMEKNNIIKRINSEEDARKKNIVLTEESKERHIEIRKSFNKISKTITQDIPQEELDIFFKVIEKMRYNINENL